MHPAARVYHPIYMEYLRKRGQKEGVADALGLAQAEGFIQNQLESAMEAHAAFEEGGKRVYDFSNLVEFFQDTDVDDIPLDFLAPPYEHFYMHFGCGHELRLPAGERDDIIVTKDSAESVLFEGAYITTWASDPNDVEEDDEVQWTITFVGRPVIDDWDNVETVRLFQLLRAYNLPFNRSGTVADSFSGAELWGVPSDVVDHLRAPLRLVINGLCYLNYENKDLEYGFPPTAPEKMRRLSASSKSTERKRGVSKLESLGFLRTYMARRPGGVLGEEAPGVSEGGTGVSSKGRKAHWRRRHWRLQAHGPKWSQRRLILIEPSFVGVEPKQPGNPVRVYKAVRPGP